MQALGAATPLKLPALVDAGRLQGVDTGLPRPAEFQRSAYPATIPSTAEIGRLFFEYCSSALPLLNPIFLKSDEATGWQPPILEQLAARFGSVEIHNIGCGGCTDVPLLAELAKELLGAQAPFTIRNYDLSPTVVQLVQSGAHPHFLHDETADDYRALPFDEVIRARVEAYRSDSFIFQGRDWVQRDGGLARYGIYQMLPALAERIDIQVGDMRRLPIASGSAHCILCFNTVMYLSSRDKTIAYRELERVLSIGGCLISDGAIFEKQKDGLHLVSGCGYENATLSSGRYPTRRQNGRLEPFAIRTEVHAASFPSPVRTLIGADREQPRRNSQFPIDWTY